VEFKNKGQVVDYWHDGEDDNYELHKIHEGHNEEPEAYLVSDINVLREKLIEDLKDAVLTYIPSYLINYRIEEIINKRFGVQK